MIVIQEIMKSRNIKYQSFSCQQSIVGIKSFTNSSSIFGSPNDGICLHQLCEMLSNNPCCLTSEPVQAVVHGFDHHVLAIIHRDDDEKTLPMFTNQNPGVPPKQDFQKFLKVFLQFSSILGLMREKLCQLCLGCFYILIAVVSSHADMYDKCMNLTPRRLAEAIDSHTDTNSGDFTCFLK